MQSSISAELVNMGFKGQILRRLESIIIDDGVWQEFQNFILLNDMNGVKMTNVLLASRFAQHMQDKHSYSSYKQFNVALNSAETTSDKQDAIAKLIVLKATQTQLNRVLELIEKGHITTSNFYDLAVRYRKSYSVSEMIVLIEEMHL